MTDQPADFAASVHLTIDAARFGHCERFPGEPFQAYAVITTAGANVLFRANIGLHFDRMVNVMGQRIDILPGDDLHFRLVVLDPAPVSA
jgi:hypothetical protein